MTRENINQYPVILCRARTQLCGLPIAHVHETMRPLPTRSLAGAPDFVVGLSLIRGAAVPVVDAGALIGATEAPAFTRFVTLRIGARTVALAVEAVLGIRNLPAAALQDLPPLLGEASPDVLSALGLLDADLLMVLQLARELTDPVLEAVELNGEPA